MDQYERKEIGTFVNISGQMTVSDPSYDKGIWCAETLNNVMTGLWSAHILISDEGEWGKRVAAIEARSERYDGEYFSYIGDIGVDSGQAGIYDTEHYQDQTIIHGYSDFAKRHDSDQWYGHNCDVTLSDKRAGVIPFGCVSRSGFGDGSYGLYAAYDRCEQIVAIQIVFIDESDDKEDSE